MKKHNFDNKKTKGAAMGYVLILITVFVLLGTAMLVMAHSNIRNAATFLTMDARYFAAESAVQLSAQRLAVHLDGLFDCADDCMEGCVDPFCVNGSHCHFFCTDICEDFEDEFVYLFEIGYSGSHSTSFFALIADETNDIDAGTQNAMRMQVIEMLNLWCGPYCGIDCDTGSTAFNCIHVFGNNTIGINNAFQPMFNNQPVQYMPITANDIVFNFSDASRVAPPTSDTNRQWLRSVESIDIIVRANSAGRELSMTYRLPFSQTYSWVSYFPETLRDIDGRLYQQPNSDIEEWLENMLDSARDVAGTMVSVFGDAEAARAGASNFGFANVTDNVNFTWQTSGRDHVFVNGDIEQNQGGIGLNGIRAIVVNGNFSINDGDMLATQIHGCPEYNTMIIVTCDICLDRANGVADHLAGDYSLLPCSPRQMDISVGGNGTLLNDVRFFVCGDVNINFSSNSSLFGNAVFYVQGELNVSGPTTGATGIQLGRTEGQDIDELGWLPPFPAVALIGAPQFYVRGDINLGFMNARCGLPSETCVCLDVNTTTVTGIFATLSNYNGTFNGNPPNSLASRTNLRGIVFSPNPPPGACDIEKWFYCDKGADGVPCDYVHRVEFLRGAHPHHSIGHEADGDRGSVLGGLWDEYRYDDGGRVEYNIPLELIAATEFVYFRYTPTGMILPVGFEDGDGYFFRYMFPRYHMVEPGGMSYDLRRIKFDIAGLDAPFHSDVNFRDTYLYWERFSNMFPSSALIISPDGYLQLDSSLYAFYDDTDSGLLNNGVFYLYVYDHIFQIEDASRTSDIHRHGTIRWMQTPQFGLTIPYTISDDDIPEEPHHNTPRLTAIETHKGRPSLRNLRETTGARR